jgi:hypothetical protein
MVGCDNLPSVEEIRTIISEDCYDKYLSFNNNALVAKNKNLIYCSTVDCNSILDTNITLKCIKCGQETCKYCKLPFHKGFSCEENQTRKF